MAVGGLEATAWTHLDTKNWVGGDEASAGRTGSAEAFLLANDPVRAEQASEFSQGSVRTLQDICWREISCSFVNTSTLLDVVAFAEAFVTPSSDDLLRRCKRLASDCWSVLCEKHAREQLRGAFGEEFCTQLDAQEEERRQAVAHLRIRGSIVEKSTLAAAQLPLQSVIGGPSSYPYLALKSNVVWPADVVPSQREQYLCDEEFVSLFGMPFPVYCKLPEWKKVALRKKLDLF